MFWDLNVAWDPKRAAASADLALRQVTRCHTWPEYNPSVVYWGMFICLLLFCPKVMCHHVPSVKKLRDLIFFSTWFLPRVGDRGQFWLIGRFGFAGQGTLPVRGQEKFHMWWETSLSDVKLSSVGNLFLLPSDIYIYVEIYIYRYIYIYDICVFIHICFI